MNGPDDYLRLRLGAAHLWELGPRAVSHFIRKSGERRADLGEILDTFDEWRERLTPEMLQATGGDRFLPRPLRLVPRS